MKEKPTKAKKKGRTIRAFKRDISLWLFCVPGVILTFIFSYIPMYGVQIAFRRFNATAGITKSPWVGMYYFERFFNSPYFASTIKNTLILSLYGLVVSFPIPIILALMLNSFRHKIPESDPDRHLRAELHFYRSYVRYDHSVPVSVRRCYQPRTGSNRNSGGQLHGEKSLLETHLCVDRCMAEYRMELCYLLRSTRRHQPGAA